MKAFGLSRWIALGVLVLTMGAFSHPANGQTQTVRSANQSVAASGKELLIASADSASAANVAASAPLAVAPTSSAPVPPPPSTSYSWTGFYVGVNVGHGSSDGDTAVNPLPSAAIFINLLPQT